MALFTHFFRYSVISLWDGPESSVDACRLIVDRRVSVPNFMNKFPTVSEIRRKLTALACSIVWWQHWGTTTQTNSPGGAKLSKSAKITHSGSIWGFITPNLLRQPQNAIHRWKGLWCGHDKVLKRWRHRYICARQEARNGKKLVREKRKTLRKILGSG